MPPPLYVLLAPLGLTSGMLQALNLGEHEAVYFAPKGMWALAVYIKATALLTSAEMRLVHPIPGTAFPSWKHPPALKMLAKENVSNSKGVQQHHTPRQLCALFYLIFIF